MASIVIVIVIVIVLLSWRIFNTTLINKIKFLFSLEFNQKLENEKMTDVQRTTARDVRRRGKNKVDLNIFIKKCLFTLELIIMKPCKNLTR